MDDNDKARAGLLGDDPFADAKPVGGVQRLTLKQAIVAIQEKRWLDPGVLRQIVAFWDAGGNDKLELQDALKACGVLAVFKDERKALKRSHLRDATEDQEDLAGALGHAGLRGHNAPAGYVIAAGGIRRFELRGESEQELVVSFAAVVLTESLVSARTGEAMYRVEWLDGSRWTGATVPRGTLMDGRKMLEVLGSRAGAPVHSGNSRELAVYFGAYEACNRDRMVTGVYYDRFGWESRECDSFILDGVKSATDTADAVGVRGDPAVWADIAAFCVLSPMAFAALCASVAAPLVKPLRTENFVLDLSGASSTGKSTALHLAASVWGFPGMPAEPGLITSWKNTRAGMEAISSLLGDLPMCLDESMMAAAGMPHYVIHSLVDGIGKQRALSDGSAARSHATGSSVISTGENPLHSFEGCGEGASVRCLALEGDCSQRIDGYRFNELDVERVKEVCLDHYGWLGRAVVEWLRGEGNVEELRDVYASKRAWSDGLLEEAGLFEAELGKRARIAKKLALLAAAWWVIEQVWPTVAGDVPLPEVGPVLWGAVVEPIHLSGSEQAAQRWQEAHDDVCTWVQSNRSRFWKKGTADSYEPANGWLGILQHEIGVVCVRPDELRSWIERNGYNYRQVIGAWRRHGIALCEAGRLTTKVRGAGGFNRYVRIILQGSE